MLNSDIIVGASTLFLAGVAWWATRDLSMFGGVFVNFTLWALVAFSLMELVKGVVKPERIEFFQSKEERNNVVVGLSILGGYLTLLPFVGFLPSSLLFFAVMNCYLGEQKLTMGVILRSVLLSVIVVAVFYVLFKHVLEVPLPPGMLFEE